MSVGAQAASRTGLPDWIGLRTPSEGISKTAILKSRTNSELTLNAVNDIIRQKAIKRNLSLKIFDYGEIEKVSGNRIKQTILLKQGIKQEIAKKISKNIRDQIKKINVSINGETLRVASKSKNDLQLAIKLISELEESLNIPLKASNFR